MSRRNLRGSPTNSLFAGAVMIDTTSPIPGHPPHVYIADDGPLCFCGRERFTGIHIAEDSAGTERCPTHGYALAADGKCLGCDPPPFVDLPAIAGALRLMPLSRLAPDAAPRHVYRDDGGWCRTCGRPVDKGNHRGR